MTGVGLAAGVTIVLNGVDIDENAPTPENSVGVNVLLDEWPSREAVTEALNAGKAVFYYYTSEPRAFVGLGRLSPDTVTLFDVDGNRSTFADVGAAMRHGLKIIEGYVHG